MVKVTVDSSVIIEKIRTDGGFYDDLLELQLGGKIELSLSVIVIAELWAGGSMEKSLKRQSAEIIIKYFRRLMINEKVAKLAGEIVRKYSVKPMDALIAASAIEDGAMLATLNVKDFIDIKELKLYK